MLLAIPLLGITGTLFLAAPIALGYRYIIAYAFCLPFMFMAGLINTDDIKVVSKIFPACLFIYIFTRNFISLLFI